VTCEEWSEAMDDKALSLWVLALEEKVGGDAHILKAAAARLRRAAGGACPTAAYLEKKELQ
jgi:hypothetical protein